MEVCEGILGYVVYIIVKWYFFDDGGGVWEIRLIERLMMDAAMKL